MTMEASRNLETWRIPAASCRGSKLIPKFFCVNFPEIIWHNIYLNFSQNLLSFTLILLFIFICIRNWSSRVCGSNSSARINTIL